MKIIGVLMNHNGAVEDISHPKPACQHRLIGLAVTGEQRWQISGVIRMLHAGGIVMAIGFRKIHAGTVRTFVNMKAEKSGVLGQPPDMGNDPNAFGFLIETDFAPKIRKISSSPDKGNRVGTVGTICHKNHLRYSI